MSTKETKDTTKGEWHLGDAVGPDVDTSFHAPDFYDPESGKRIETPWDSEEQKADKGFDPKVMAGTTEDPAPKAKS